MKKLLLLICVFSSTCLIANEKMYKDDKGRWVNSKGGNIYGDSRFNLEADPGFNLNADPRYNLDADPKFNFEADPLFSIDGDKRYQ
jgi:hypothetical protein